MGLDSDLAKEYLALKKEFIEFLERIHADFSSLTSDLAKAGQPFDEKNEHRYRLTLLREKALYLTAMAEKLQRGLDASGLVLTTRARIDGLEKQAECANKAIETAGKLMKDRYHMDKVSQDEYDAGDMLTWLLYHPEWQAEARAEAKNTVTRPEAYRAYMVKRLQDAMREG